VGCIVNKLTISIDNETVQNMINKLRSAGCVFAEEEVNLLVSEARNLEDLTRLIEERANGEPLEYVLGFADFYGLRIKLKKGVFVPRKRTEFLVKQAIALVSTGDIVVDLCCGSGAVGAAVAAESNQIILYSADIDPIAVKCTLSNIPTSQSFVFEGDMYDALPYLIRGKVNLVVANVPYVPTQAITLLPHEARIYESKVALDGGIDGLDLQRKIAEEAPHWLAPGGFLLVETSERQALRTFEIFARAGFTTQIVKDEEMDATVVIGRYFR
jgi:release factor glutamine methyltransferase